MVSQIPQHEGENPPDIPTHLLENPLWILLYAPILAIVGGIALKICLPKKVWKAMQANEDKFRTNFSTEGNYQDNYVEEPQEEEEEQDEIERRYLIYCLTSLSKKARKMKKEKETKKSGNRLVKNVAKITKIASVTIVPMKIVIIGNEI